jgi:hypothetical protein
MPMQPNPLPFVFILLFLAWDEAALAATYKWVDEKGVTHYGDTIPPEYRDRANTEINQGGVVIKRNGAITPEMLKAKEEELSKKQQEAEVKRRDALLIKTYSSVQEIDLARDRNLQQVEQVIKDMASRLNAVQADLDAIRKQAEDYTRANTPAPNQLKSDIAVMEQNKRDLEIALSQKRKEADDIRARFEAEKKRYIELTQDTPVPRK